MPLVIKDDIKSRTLVSDIENLLDHIINIFNGAKLDLKQVEEKVRIEKFHHYNQNLINKTMRDAKSFTSDGTNIYPKKIDSFVFEDNLDIYENRFVASLLLEIKKDLLNTIKYNDKKLSFLTSGISYGSYGTNQILTKYASDSFNKELNKGIKTDLLSKINYLMDKDVYKRISKINLDDIIVTNVLVEDVNYNACYLFYKKGLERNNDFKQLIINELKEKLSNDSNLNQDETKIVYKEDNFIYSLSFNEDIHLEVSYEKEIVSYEFDFQIGLFNSYLIIKYNDEDYKIMINDVNDILEVLNSLRLVFNTSSDSCPICHHSLNELECSTCSASYKKISEDKLWLTNIFRIKEDI